MKTRELFALEKEFALAIEPIPQEFTEAGLQFLGREEVEGRAEALLAEYTDPVLASLERKTIENLFGPYSIFRFKNDSSGIKLGVAVGPAGISSTIVSISSHKYFGLNDYLSAHKRIAEKDALWDLSKKPTLYLQFIRSLVANEWREIIQGKRWEDIRDSWRDDY